jgi:Holliday junction resolvase RusA-like endonuclease
VFSQHTENYKNLLDELDTKGVYTDDMQSDDIINSLVDTRTKEEFEEVAAQ